VTTPRPRPSLRASALRSLGAAIILGALAASPSLAVAPDPSAVTARSAAPATVSGLTLVKSGLVQPLYVTHAGDERLFVVERTGRIRILKDTGPGWTISGTFLDLRGKVDTGHSEQGLLGLAFHPDYATNGRFYVNYTDPKGDTVVAEYRRDTEGTADPTSKRLVLKVNQPFDNHNGGWIAFKGPYLYIALGDGGSGGDPYGNGQDTGTRLGKILRIDPLDPDGSGPKRYSVPADNPFVGKPGLDEIWAYGLRNPWRNSFDRETGHLWIGDVGQDRYEEISRSGTGKGKNFGWDRVEGRHLYPSGALCASNCKTLPVVEYKHKNGNCSIVGGYVSRRPGAALEGRYLFGDTCSGRIWDIAATATSAKPGTPRDTSLFISSFGEDVDGRLYVTDLGGRVYLVNGS
jgi:glucose/arabinose dehydrogenase